MQRWKQPEPLQRSLCPRQENLNEGMTRLTNLTVLVSKAAHTTLNPKGSLEKNWGCHLGVRGVHGAGRLSRRNGRTRAESKMELGRSAVCGESRTKTSGTKKNLSGHIRQEPGQGQDNRDDVQNIQGGDCQDVPKTELAWLRQASGCDQFTAETTFLLKWQCPHSSGWHILLQVLVVSPGVPGFKMSRQ